jgi:hypothetical protein
MWFQDFFLSRENGFTGSAEYFMRRERRSDFTAL